MIDEMGEQSMPAGPLWLTLPLAVLLLVTLYLALRTGDDASPDPAACAGFALSGLLLIVAGLLSWPMVGSVVVTDVLLYGAAQSWIAAFWSARGQPDEGGDEGGAGDPAGGDGPPPAWWPDFEKQFRDYDQGRSGDRGPRVPV